MDDCAICIAFALFGSAFAAISVIALVFRWWIKPPRMQVHLLTVIILTFTCGALLWLNLRPQEVAIFPEQKTNFIYYRYGYGWPFRIWWTYRDNVILTPDFWQTSFWIGGGLDGITSLAVVAFIMFICEWIIRNKNKLKRL